MRRLSSIPIAITEDKSNIYARDVQLNEREILTKTDHFGTRHEFVPHAFR